MIIYKDIVSGDELVSDTYKVEYLENGEVMKVTGKNVTETTNIDDSTFGGNASAEGGGDEGAEASSVSGVNIVLTHRLAETGFGKKKELQVCLKDLFAKVKEKISEDDFKKFKTGAGNFIAKTLLPEFKEFQFFLGESNNPEGSMGFMKWDDDAGVPYMYFFTRTLEAEKV